MSDEELRTKVEQGRVPLCFALASSDIVVARAPKPVFVHALRTTYIPLLALASAQDAAVINGTRTPVAGTSALTNADINSSILLRYSFYAQPDGGSSPEALLANVWFDVAGVPVKWFVFCTTHHKADPTTHALTRNNTNRHLPVGVLYDYFMHARGLEQAQASAVLNVTVHFHNFPERSKGPGASAACDLVLRCPTEVNVQAQYFYSLKEAHFIKHGGIDRINKLGPEQMQRLWNAVVLGDTRTFRELSAVLCPDATLDAAHELKSVPVRVLYDPAQPVAQFGVPAATACIGDVLERAAHEVAKHAPAADSGATPGRRSLYCCGVRIDDQPALPLLFVYRTFFSTDNYLYFAYLEDSTA